MTPPKWVTATVAGVVAGHFVADTFKHPAAPDVSGPPKAALTMGSTGTAVSPDRAIVNAISGSEHRITPPLDRYSKVARTAYRKNGGSLT